MRILVVDDDLPLAKSIASALQSCDPDWHVSVATSSQEALEAADMLDPEVVVTDWDLGMLSEDDGDDLAREIKRLWPTTLVVLWSNVTRPTVDEADNQLVKRDIDELLGIVRLEARMRLE